MIEISVVRDVLACFGVIAGLSYYILTVRNQNRTRHAQLFNQVVTFMGTYDFWRHYRKVMYMQWEDYDDFEKNMARIIILKHMTRDFSYGAS